MCRSLAISPEKTWANQQVSWFWGFLKSQFPLSLQQIPSTLLSVNICHRAASIYICLTRVNSGGCVFLQRNFNQRHSFTRWSVFWWMEVKSFCKSSDDTAKFKVLIERVWINWKRVTEMENSDRANLFSMEPGWRKTCASWLSAQASFPSHSCWYKTPWRWGQC